MRKTITYTTFIFACVVVAILFVTSKSYVQLSLAIILYPAIAYLALKLFPRKTTVEIKKESEAEVPVASFQIQETPDTINSVPEPIQKGEVKNEVADIDKRAFLKLIGAAGLSVFVLSILSRKGLPFFGKNSEISTVTVKDTEGKPITPAQSQPFDGYQISEIDDGAISYYGFIHQNGSWFIMKEDTEANTFRYAKGLSNFPKSWNSRMNMKYDYFYNA